MARIGTINNGVRIGLVGFTSQGLRLINEQPGDAGYEALTLEHDTRCASLRTRLDVGSSAPRPE